jgi:hypothetical protein
MTVQKTYTVHVCLTVNFWGNVEVEADSQQAAEERAAEEFECDWGRAEWESVATTVLTENGCPVEYSVEAFGLDPMNPYRPVTAGPANTKTGAPESELGTLDRRGRKL